MSHSLYLKLKKELEDRKRRLISDANARKYLCDCFIYETCDICRGTPRDASLQVGAELDVKPIERATQRLRDCYATRPPV